MRHFSLRGETPLVWSHSEVVITLPCHGSITGSNPVGTVAIPRMTIEIQVVNFLMNEQNVNSSFLGFKHTGNR